MIKILALGAHSGLRALEPQLKKQGIELFTSPDFSRVRIEIIKNQVEIYVENKNIREFDFVWINSTWKNRQFANAITVNLRHNKIAHTKVEGEKSKLVDNVALASYGVDIPNTFYASTDKLNVNIRNIERVCRYPVIIKITRGCLGKGIYLAKNRIELENVLNNDLEKSEQYICQEFIPNDYDYRIIVSDQKTILSSEKRIRKGDEFKNNASLGAKEVFLKPSTLDRKLTKISINSAKVLKLDWTGIDVVKSKKDGNYYVLELNRRPGLTEESSEITAAYDHILSMLTKKGLYIES